MERYFEQLMDDLQQVITNLKPIDAKQESENFSHIEKYERNEVTPISEITGIEQEQLPPVKMLNQEQKALLADRLEELLQSFHILLNFPINYPSHLRYAFIRKLWKEEQVAVSRRHIHIEFCEFEEEKCPFPGYCNSCKDILEDYNFAKSHESRFNSKKIETEDCPFDPFGDEDDEPYTEDISEFYDSSAPIPNLCIICKKNQLDDWDENLLCLMTRNDQSNQPNFECGGFEKV